MAELKTFLFTDICRSVDLKNEMSGRSVTERDMAFIQRILIPHRERIEAHLEEHTGRVVSTAGDGHFLVFNNTIQAAMWAADVQRSHRDDPIETPGGGRVEVRISIHVGVPQVDPAAPDNFVGKSVDYASRLNDYATGGQILVSRSVMAILDDVGLEGIRFHQHGRRQLKGIGHVEVHELLYDDQAPRPLRQQPSSHSDRQWTVIPTVLAGHTSMVHDSAVAAAPLLKRVGNYELEALLGSGGMGDVYKGRHIQFGRVRAIKVIKPQFVAAGNEEIVRRFYQEIKAIGNLQHKNIVVAIDSSAPTDKLHYLVMEYLEGVTVDELVAQNGQLNVADACEIIRQAARGLQYIHRNDMVHRDIKPSNLMVTLVDHDGVASEPHIAPDGEEPLQGVVKILDLGLALLAGDTTDRLTRFDNKAMGTGMYMSPEQWRTTSVDIRADIYSLGCSLYHLLSGQPPFFDSDLRPEKAHEKSSVPPIRNTNLPRKLWEIIQKMLAKRPADRYATPAEVAAELTPFCEGHDLVGLVRSYMNPDMASSSHRYTRVDSAAGIDTWLSRASHLYPSRQWVVRRGLPGLILVGAFIGLFWSAREARKRTIAEAMQQARDTLPVSAEAAAGLIGDYLTKRFLILQQAAAEPELVQMLNSFSATQARQELEEYPLAVWIRQHRYDNIDAAPTDSWFINDVHGIQIARHPLTEESGQVVDSFLQDYAYRDYFHGLGKNLTEAEAENAQPIERPNLSAVYISTTTGKLKVAFSVPIWDQPESGEAPKVMGVLSMSVDLGTFEVLNTNLQRGKDIVLVDLREDYLDTTQTTPQRGLILKHPHQSLKKGMQHPPRIDPLVQEAMLAGDDDFVAGFKDPLSIDPDETYWGAFEPVVYSVRDLTSHSLSSVMSQWMVLVQSPAIK